MAISKFAQYNFPPMPTYTGIEKIVQELRAEKTKAGESPSLSHLEHRIRFIDPMADLTPPKGKSCNEIRATQGVWLWRS